MSTANVMRELLESGQHSALLIEHLGWNHPRAVSLTVTVEEDEYELHPIAEKAGFAIYECSPDPSGAVPRYAVRRKIEGSTDLPLERAIVFTDARRQAQVWQWVSRESGERPRCREHWARRRLGSRALLDRLQFMWFRLEEESRLTVVDVVARVREALDHETPYGRLGEKFRKRTAALPAAEPAISSTPLAVAVSTELTNALRGLHPRWGDRVDRIEPEDDNQRGAGILIRHPGGAPVIAAVEVDAGAAEAQARRALRAAVEDTGAFSEVEQAIALVVPDELRSDQSALAERIGDVSFSYCLFSLDEGEQGVARWPSHGWLRGDTTVIADLIERAAISERMIAQGLKVLENSVRNATGTLRGQLDRPGVQVLEAMADVLRQEDAEQTTRMAVTIIANPLTVHDGVAATHESVPSLAELEHGGPIDKEQTLAAWERILEINYWPIFDVAHELLSCIPEAEAKGLIGDLRSAADELTRLGITTTQDLAGQMFGRLIADRKFLATFYTRPASAALLAELAVGRLDTDWTDAEQVESLRIADLACGTGALLSAAYHAAAVRRRRAGGDDRDHHRPMMEHSLIGADIMPAAAHLTASMLSSAQPAQPYEQTRIHTMEYGRLEGGGVAIGSLDLIGETERPVLFATGESEHAKGDGGNVISLPPESLDLAIMNPPFVRSTNHEGDHAEVPVPAFAGFGASEADQADMGDALKKVRSKLTEPAGHGNAGLGSNFIDLANQKAKGGGVLALVLPLTMANGAAWAGTRDMLARQYRDTTVIAIAATGSKDRAFSDDTGMAEALILASKRDKRIERDLDNAPTLFVNLLQRPRTTIEAEGLARIIAAIPEDASGFLRAGNEVVGSYIRATLAEGGCAALDEPYLGSAAAGMYLGELRLPGLPEPAKLRLAPLAVMGTRGKYHLDISGPEKNRAGLPRGPFDIERPHRASSRYPALWNHDADRERRLIVKPDSRGKVRKRMMDKADKIWATATRLHFSLDFRVNSQSLAACLTPSVAIGGTAWPNFSVEGDPRREEALALWANTTPGLISFWWIAARQQQGRARLTISQLPRLTALDVRTLDEKQLKKVESLFADFAKRDFLPANEAYRDETRQDLDRSMLCDLLGLPESILEPLAALRHQWCEEPSVHGGKPTRPGGGG
ncbi:MAG: hypothetical protein OXH40_05930 [Chloroflexi bacterium]|nr:hypothetical protein [Chloroflexota bacterium]MDE2709250.1 hypothetical protein [Chloroflexota bacterium]